MIIRNIFNIKYDDISSLYFRIKNNYNIPLTMYVFVSKNCQNDIKEFIGYIDEQSYEDLT
jgi:hypothetical protein